MKNFKKFILGALLSAAIATPVIAQAHIDDAYFWTDVYAHNVVLTSASATTEDPDYICHAKITVGGSQKEAWGRNRAVTATASYAGYRTIYASFSSDAGWYVE
ncbi:hypothetical protein JHL18_18830 [Clostridium sp. YIM B02505]|uniref:Uncharacterized protein n=1 Tax=Clostridium yunnanense TaxID=2800325 RepID=A0ABS1ETF9_9CLOT|nr:hypothetical protein [Clostridium yunnanense]MBK1812679.1 hypothetical protein [Clostridium yunnanense]